MKKLLLLLPFLAFVFMPSIAEASNFAGVKVIIKKEDGTLLNGIGVDLRSDTSGSYNGGDATRKCDSDSDPAGPFVNLNSKPDKYYQRLYGLKTGEQNKTYGGQTYDNPNGTIYFGNGVNSTNNGGGMGFGFACSCNPLKLIIHVPSGYYYDGNANGQLDNGESIASDVTVSKSGLTNDKSYTYTFYLGDAPTVSRSVSMPSTADIGTTVTVTQSMTHNNDGDPIGTAYIRNNFSSNGLTGTRSGTSANPYAIVDVASATNRDVSSDSYAGSITATSYTTNGYQWKFKTSSGSNAIVKGTWTERITFTIKNDASLDGKVVGTKIGAGIYPNGTYWALSNHAALTINAPDAPPPSTALACTVSPESGPVPFVVDITTTSSGLTTPFTYNMGEGGADISRGASFSYTYNTANPAGYSIRVCHNSYTDPDDGDHCEICTPNPIVPTNPADGGGGEVAP